jgi:Fic family protein
MVAALLDDLCAFCNGDGLPAIAQAALAHAQFETIHPFVDGNGRVGRALIHLVLRRRGLAPRVLAPVSLVLATLSREYIDGLTATRYVGDSGSAEAHEGLNRWISVFAAACQRAAIDASAFEDVIRDLQQGWRARLGQVRANSSIDRLLRALPGSPVVTVNSAAELIGRSFQAANEAITRLAEEGILTQISLGRRNRGFEARQIVDAFTDLERGLASPEWDTRLSAPVRAVPRRRAAKG